jgi:hypothetical protein
MPGMSSAASVALTVLAWWLVNSGARRDPAESATSEPRTTVRTLTAAASERRRLFPVFGADMLVSCRYAEAATENRAAQPEHKSDAFSVNGHLRRCIARHGAEQQRCTHPVRRQG